MALAAGARLGPYEVVSPLGAGGMGEVYRARDTRLDRAVAIKVLAAAIAESPDARARFEREARTVSHLSHPHICQLHDVGSEDGTSFLVMEFIEGETLAARLAKGPLPLDVTLRYATQMADALAAAHRAGVVHRDLKPANVMLPKSGLKLLDFGLAREVIGGGDATHAATSPVTAHGAVTGTIQYMAPEQFEGRAADERSDIWSLGAVVYEMATGQRAFKSNLQPLSPPALDRIVRTCLAADPDDRWQSARDIALQLRAIDGADETASPTHRSWLPWAVAALAGAIAVAAVVQTMRSRPSGPAPTVRFATLPPAGQAFWDNLETDPVAIAQDGSRFGFIASDGKAQRVWIRAMGEVEAQPITGTEGARSFFWSPDGRSIGFFAGGKLQRIELPNGAPVAICDVADGGLDGTWSVTGDVLFAPVSGEAIYRVAASGGAPVVERGIDGSAGKGRVHFPIFLPDGRRYLYRLRDQADATAIILAEPGKPERKILSDVSNAQFMDPDVLVYAKDGTLLGQRFDADRGVVVGAPVPITDHVRYFLSTGMARFAVSRTGTIVYHSQWDTERVVWLDRTGRETGTVSSGSFIALRINRDGSRIAYSRSQPRIGTWDVWLADVARGLEQRLTSDPRSEVSPVWHPNDESILFAGGAGVPHLIRRTLSSGQEVEVLANPDNRFQSPEDVSNDGKTLLFVERGPEAGIYAVPLDGPANRTALIRSRFVSYQPRLSPNGKLMAFVSNETGRNEVYVSSYPPSSLKIPASSGGGTVPRWSRDGSELFFLSSDRRLMGVPVGAAPSLSVGAAAALFPLPGRRVWKDYDVSTDGKRFLAIVTDLLGDEQPMTVVTSWKLPE